MSLFSSAPPRDFPKQNLFSGDFHNRRRRNGARSSALSHLSATRQCAHTGRATGCVHVDLYVVLTAFRMNTCKSVSKQRTLSPFKMNTCEKTGGGAW